jgi:hypothetical protein
VTAGRVKSTSLAAHPTCGAVLAEQDAGLELVAGARHILIVNLQGRQADVDSSVSGTCEQVLVLVLVLQQC